MIYSETCQQKSDKQSQRAFGTCGYKATRVYFSAPWSSMAWPGLIKLMIGLELHTAVVKMQTFFTLLHHAPILEVRSSCYNGSSLQF
jgi:hypothetical protein